MGNDNKNLNYKKLESLFCAGQCRHVKWFNQQQVKSEKLHGFYGDIRQEIYNHCSCQVSGGGIRDNDFTADFIPLQSITICLIC